MITGPILVLARLGWQVRNRSDLATIKKILGFCLVQHLAD